MQLIALGFTNPDFHGEIIAELERLHQSGTVRVIDSLAQPEFAVRLARGGVASRTGALMSA